MNPEKIFNDFKNRFNSEPIVVKSPGRVNLIGEHTDYNNGFVLPAAIDKVIIVALQKSNKPKSSLYSIDLDETAEFNVNEISKNEKHWANYIIGVVDQLNKHGHKIENFDCMFSGDIPIGAGLSSSAALECGTIYGLNELFKLNIAPIDIVKYGQKAENEFVGVRCGIMDQFINVFGKSGHALKIDCLTLDYEYEPFDFKDISIVLFNTGVTHTLASSEYNQRRKECETGFAIIQKAYPHITNFREIDNKLLEEIKPLLPEIIYNRCKYVIQENMRLLNGCKALTRNDLKEFGKLMFETHNGLSKDYQVSCKELDFLVEQVKCYPGVYGARMMGGGFGGCTINLIENNHIQEIEKNISSNYFDEFGIKLKTYITTISCGTSLISIK